MNGFDHRSALPHSAAGGAAGEDLMSRPDVGTAQLEDTTDGVLVDYAVEGNEAAFEILVRRHQPLMRRYAQGLLGSNAEADDVVQESWIIAWQKLSTLRDCACLNSWLMRVVQNRSMDRLRMRPSSTLPLDDNTPDTLHNGPVQVVEMLLRSDALFQVLASLPANQRRAWLMRGGSGFSYLVIAGKLGVPVSTVRGLLARSRHTLAREMARWR